MAILRAYSPVLHFDDDEGNPLAGGWLYTYLAGTSTPVATYADSTGTLNDVQIELDGRGECEVWLDSSKKYKFVVLDRNKAHPTVKDNVSVPAGGGGGSSVDITSTDGTVTITPSAGAFDLSIQSALDTKKDKQQNSDTSSTATKTLTRITQDTNGVIYPHFDDIDFPVKSASKGLKLNSDGSLEINIGEGLYINDNKLSLEESIEDYIDITNEWSFLNSFELQYLGNRPGESNAMKILYSEKSGLVKFTGSMRVNRQNSISNGWNQFLRYNGNRFYTTRTTDVNEYFPKLGITDAIGGQVLVPGSEASGTSISVLCKLGYVGNMYSAEDTSGLAFSYVVGNVSMSNVYGVLLSDLVLRVTKRP